MSRITAAAELTRDELKDAPDEEWIDTLLEKDNQLGRQVVSNINQNLPFLNCPTSKLNDPLVMVHGVPLTIKNPLNTPIRSVMAVACIGLSVDSTGKPTRGTYNLGLPQIEWHPSGKQDGSVVVTANFPPPTGSIIAYRNAALSQSVAASSLAFDTVESQGVGGLSLSSGSILCASAGIVQGSFVVAWTLSILGTFRYAHFQKNAVGSLYGLSVLGPMGAAGTATTNNGTGRIPVAAGDVINVRTGQDSGGALALEVATQRVRVDAQYVAPPVGTTGKVTLFFAGGE